MIGLIPFGGVVFGDQRAMRALTPAELNALQLQQLQSMAQAPVNDAALRGMVNFRPYPDPPQRPLDERFADFKVRLSAALKRHGIPEIPIPSVLKTKGATTAVQSCLPRSAVVANLFTSSRGGGGSRTAKATIVPDRVVGTAQVKTASAVSVTEQSERARDVGGLIPPARKSAMKSDPRRNVAQAGVAPGPREALSDPVFFNAALHRETV